jgi:4'-phosphopantetheinyl transferase
MGMEDMGYERSGLAQVQYTQFDKPYFPGHIHFNISHAGNYVLSALCDRGPIGVDVEKVSEVNIADFMGFFTRSELRYIHAAAHNLEAFYRCWTRKEAVVKADGRGLNLSLLSFETINDEVYVGDGKWFLKELPVAENYIAHLASDSQIHDCEEALIYKKSICYGSVEFAGKSGQYARCKASCSKFAPD